MENNNSLLNIYGIVYLLISCVHAQLHMYPCSHKLSFWQTDYHLSMLSCTKAGAHKCEFEVWCILFHTGNELLRSVYSMVLTLSLVYSVVYMISPVFVYGVMQLLFLCDSHIFYLCSCFFKSLHTFLFTLLHFITYFVQFTA